MNDVRTLTQDICANVVGGSGVVSLQSGSVISGSNDLFTIMKPHHFSGTRVRLSEEVIAESTALDCETKQESERRVIEILENETLFGSLPQVESDISKHILDLGNEIKWPYLNDHKWLHRLNIKIKHPSVTIETLKMSDGKHLVVVLNHSW
jgi:hypothetical protein